MWGDVRALDTWGDRIGLLREHALPGRSYMAQKYPNARLRWLPILYATARVGRIAPVEDTARLKELRRLWSFASPQRPALLADLH